MAATHSAKIIIASGTGNAAGATTNGTEVDNTAGYGMLVCGRCANGSTGPTLPAQMNVYTGESTGTKRLFQTLVFDPGNSVTSERTCQIPKDAMFVNVSITGNTGQSVTCEVYGQQTTGQ